MSLRVWLPLTKDLRNQGLDDVTVTNNGAIFNSTGKLGGCYYFNNAYAWLPMDYSTFGIEFSVAFWYKIDTAFSGNRHLVCLCNQYGWERLKFTCAATSNSTLAFNIGDGSTSARSLSTSQIVGSWQHICFTFNNKEAKVYVNGVQTGTATYSINPDWSGTTKMGIGGAPDGHECATTLSLNDIRIYDHCLSPMEVKEISKGLILHYPLNRGGWGQENLIVGSQLNGNFTYPSSSYKDWYSPTTTVIPSGSTYTLSFDAKSTVSGDKVVTHYYSPNTTTGVKTSQGYTSSAVDGYAPFTLTTEWQRYWVTYTQSSTTAVKHLICPRLTSGNGTGTVSVKNVKFEEGSIATPWCPNSSDELAITLGMNDNIEYDCSGYCNNGTRTGTFSWTSDTPKYNASTEFNTNNYIIIDPLTIDMNNVSFAIWVKWDAFNSYSRIWDFGQVASGGGYCCFLMNNATNGSIKLRLRNASGTELLNYNFITANTNTWYHIAFTLSNTTCKVYVNGILKDTKTLSSNIGTATFNYPYIGKSNWPTDALLDGKLSDFRIYATALSTDDVKSLYQNSAYIDNQGNIYGAVYEEV